MTTLAAICAATAANAQSASTSHERRTGDSEGGAYVRFATTAYSTSRPTLYRDSQVTASTVMHVTLYGKTVHGASSYMKVRRRTFSWMKSRYARTRVGGNTIISGYLQEGNYFAGGHAPARVLSSKQNIHVSFGRASVTIHANAGLNYRYTTRDGRSSTRQVRLDGYAQPYTTGTTSLRVIAIGASVSRSAVLRWGSNRKTVALFASPGRVGGRLSWALSALRLYVRVTVRRGQMIGSSSFKLDKYARSQTGSRVLR